MADYVAELKTFAKDSIRLVKRCNKPDAKGVLKGGERGRRAIAFPQWSRVLAQGARVYRG